MAPSATEQSYAARQWAMKRANAVAKAEALKQQRKAAQEKAAAAAQTTMRAMNPLMVSR